MTPAHQRLAADNETRPQADAGLIVQFELLEGERAAQIALEPALAADLAARMVLEDLEASPPCGFHAGERDRGVLEQFIGGLAVLGGAYDPDACADRDRVAEDVVGLGHVVQYTSRQPFALIDLAAAGLNDGEFIVAQAR